MEEVPSPLRLRISLLGTAWLALGVLYVILACVTPRGILTDPLLPIWARAALAGTELTWLAVVVVLLGLGFIFLARWVRGVILAGLLLGLAISWTAFWLSGQFLNRDGIAFCITNGVPVLRYALQMHA